MSNQNYNYSPNQSDNENNSQNYQSDSSGFQLHFESTQDREQWLIDHDPNRLSPGHSSYYTTSHASNQYELSNPFNAPDPYEQLSSCDTMNTQMRFKWNEPVINYSDSTLSTNWLDREPYKESSSEYDILSTRESAKESNGNQFFSDYQLSSDTTIVYQDSRDDFSSEKFEGTHNFLYRDTLSRSSTYVYEPDLVPVNHQPKADINEDGTIPCTQPSNVRYGEYLSSLNDEYKSNDV